MTLYDMAIDGQSIRLAEDERMDRATLSSKYQIVIPKAVRDAMGWEPGQALVFIPKGNIVHLVPQRDVWALRGALKSADPSGYRDRTDA